MDSNILNNLNHTFQEGITKIFANNLAFAFIFGSMAKGKEKKTSDIDMLVCTKNEPTEQQKADFFNFYMETHKLYGFFPDKDFPGELVSLYFLMKNIDFIQNWCPHKEIQTYREFEAVFYTAVMSEQKMAVIDHEGVLKKLESHCNDLVRQWKNEVIARNENFNPDLLSLLDVLTREGYRFLVQDPPEDGDFLK